MIFSLCRIILTAAADVTGKDEEIQEATADEKQKKENGSGTFRIVNGKYNYRFFYID